MNLLIHRTITLSIPVDGGLPGDLAVLVVLVVVRFLDSADAARHVICIFDAGRTVQLVIGIDPREYEIFLV